MALGDGIRRNVATVSQQERDLLLDAFLKLDTTKFYPDGVSYWDKQEDIHKNAHFHGVDVHAGPAFIPWHRVLVNRLEELLREIHPEISLHYWDWTTDPRAAAGGGVALFTPNFMAGSNGKPAGTHKRELYISRRTISSHNSTLQVAPCRRITPYRQRYGAGNRGFKSALGPLNVPHMSAYAYQQGVPLLLATSPK